MQTGNFPAVRLRRNRVTPAQRRLVAETKLSVDDLIWPVFVTEGRNVKEEISSMPGVFRVSCDLLEAHLDEAVRLGIPAIALFPAVPDEKKDEAAHEALKPDNLICRAVRVIKKTYPDLLVIGDVALDPYTSHGHDGLVAGGYVLNDETIEVLIKLSLNLAEAGTDIIAPSDMMDGRIGAVRAALENKGFFNTRIMSYAVKYASAFYGPFREALGSGKALKGDKKTYQLDPANAEEALREAALDIAEGADMLIIKPGMPYLDILSKVKEKFKIPVFSYQVSGEYAMLQAAIAQRWLDKKVITESLLAAKRAGASGILTYFAPEAAKMMTE